MSDNRLDGLDQGADGVPILFIPGLGADRRQFTEDVAWFADQRRSLAMSMRGHGESFRPPSGSDRSVYATAELAGDVLSELDLRGIERVDVVGNSMGGLVAFELLAARPELIRSITTFGTTGELHRGGLVGHSVVGMTRLLGPSRMGALAKRTSSKDPAVGRLVATMMSDTSKDAMAGCAAAIADYDYLPLLREPATPYLLLRSEFDKDINSLLDSTLDVLSARQEAKVVEVPKAGHFANLDAPAFVRETVADFHSGLGD